MTLYRGLAVPAEHADSVRAAILRAGLSGEEGRKFSVPDVGLVRQRLATLYQKPDLARSDVLDPSVGLGICACGDELGATYYAATHNYHQRSDNCPLLVKFTAATADVYVDPRDFLCTAFQLWDQRGATELRDRQGARLEALFGPAIRRYFDAACGSPEQSYRIAMCNLSAFDPAVLAAHLANTQVIGGRYGTRFTSAVFVRAPVPANAIARVTPIAPRSRPPSDIELSDFLRGAC